MTTLAVQHTALDDRVGELLNVSSLAGRILQIVELVQEARDRLTTAEQLADRLPRSELLELNGRIDSSLVSEFRRSMARVDSSPLTVDLDHLIALQEALFDAASDLRQEVYDAQRGRERRAEALDA
jgi:hypothetical protein